MLIEPMTNPNARKQRIIYGVLAAVLFIVYHQIIERHDLPLALATANVFVPALNMLKLEFGKKEAEKEDSAIRVQIYKSL